MTTSAEVIKTIDAMYRGGFSPQYAVRFGIDKVMAPTFFTLETLRDKAVFDVQTRPDVNMDAFFEPALVELKAHADKHGVSL